ncbi:hypothetical protein UlMin_005404 [Ulmus minor]
MFSKKKISLIFAKLPLRAIQLSLTAPNNSNTLNSLSILPKSSQKSIVVGLRWLDSGGRQLVGRPPLEAGFLVVVGYPPHCYGSSLRAINPSSKAGKMDFIAHPSRFSSSHLIPKYNYPFYKSGQTASGGNSPKDRRNESERRRRWVCALVALCLGQTGMGNVTLFGLWPFLIFCSGKIDRIMALFQLKIFTRRELMLATNNFSEKNFLGRGGFGKVYKGVLSNNTQVVVKWFTDCKSPRGDATFQCELEMISVTNHRNILRLIGYCATPTESFLVYPRAVKMGRAFRPGQEARSTARPGTKIKPGEAVLDWRTRKRVALGTARGLEYLHEHCNPKIIHHGVKAANILLDEDFEAVVGGFGFAMLVDVRKTNVTTQARGTLGHIAPEYVSTGKASDKTDVFGYGIMLLELLTGLRTIDYSRLDEGGLYLLDHVKKLEREKRLDAIVDHNLKNDYDIQEVEMIIRIALLCAQQSPQNRPAMSDVVRMLEGEGLAERWEQWQNVEVTHRQEAEQLWGSHWIVDSVNYQDASELSGPR